MTFGTGGLMTGSVIIRGMTAYSRTASIGLMKNNGTMTTAAIRAHSMRIPLPNERVLFPWDFRRTSPSNASCLMT